MRKPLKNQIVTIKTNSTVFVAGTVTRVVKTNDCDCVVNTRMGIANILYSHLQEPSHADKAMLRKEEKKGYKVYIP